MKDGHQPLRPKSRGKGIMISAFLTPMGPLRVPDHITNNELLKDLMWPKDDNGLPIREAIHYLGYGKVNYWTGEKMVDQTIKVNYQLLRHRKIYY